LRAVAPDRSGLLSLEAQEFSFHIGPVQWGLVYRNPRVISAEKYGEGNGPHWYVATKFGHKARELLIEQGGHVQQGELIMETGVERLGREYPDEGKTRNH
jgi:hypothetical protein